MILLFTGLVLGFTLGFVMLALLTKSKEAEMLACRALEQAPPLGDERLLVSRS
jgi:hypothetical protein